jgi:hypothetical protein
MSNTYTDTPIASHTLAMDQPTIEANFLYLANTLGTSNSKNGDHQISLTGVDTTSFEGRHRQVCLNNRHGLAPTVAGIGDGTDALIYSDNGNIFFGTSVGAGNFKMTTFNANTLGGLASFATGPGWTFLPGGLIMQYGIATITGSSSPQTISFPITFPGAVFSVTTTGISSNSSTNTVNISSGSIATNQFQIFNSATTSVLSMYWMAIGN